MQTKRQVYLKAMQEYKMKRQPRHTHEYLSAVSTKEEYLTALTREVSLSVNHTDRYAGLTDHLPVSTARLEDVAMELGFYVCPEGQPHIDSDLCYTCPNVTVDIETVKRLIFTKLSRGLRFG